MKGNSGSLMRGAKVVAMVLMILAALNWGSVGFFGVDVIGNLFGGDDTGAARFIFGLMGLAGLYGLSALCRCCSGKGCCCHCGGKCSCKKK